jgi:acetylornithine deacetylase/succinyl-diaminopimelate desuccinylase-like protein
MYGHMDKQPFGDGWLTDPCDPVIKDGKLYGRGSVDDGYAFFSACLCIKACQDLGIKHPRVVITIEGSEEGEIDDLKFYLDKYKGELGNPDLVFCLDAGGDRKDTMTITTTLRGCLNFDLKVTVAEDNLHSGLGGGMMPQPFQIMVALLSRVQDMHTQDMHQAFHVDIPEYASEGLRHLAAEDPKVPRGPMTANMKTCCHKYHG